MQPNTPEVWKSIPGYEGLYEVSDQGRVRSLDRVVYGKDGRVMNLNGQLLKAWTQKSGHFSVSLGRGGREYVHRLVLRAFRGDCPEGMEACHWDDDPANNRLSNLRWGTKSHNGLDRVRNGKHPTASRTHCKYGHVFDEENTHIRPGGGRTCKACRRRRKREENARNKLTK